MEHFESHFEECAPGRNSGANAWSAFGIDGDKDFNSIGREMRVRYPAFDLVFRVHDGEKEISPDSLGSFRLGLINNRLPAIWGGWRYGDLLYKVSVMTVPDPANGDFDLYKLQVQNPTDHVLRGEPDKALDYFCAYVDTAGTTLSWGEGYDGLIATGDQPHFWADAQYVNLFRHPDRGNNINVRVDVGK